MTICPFFSQVLVPIYYYNSFNNPITLTVGEVTGQGAPPADLAKGSLLSLRPIIRRPAS